MLHPDKLNEQLSARQLAEWEVFNSIDPIGEEREDIRMGVLAATFANMMKSAWGGKSASSKTFKPADFIPKWDKDDEQQQGQSTEEMYSILMGMASK